jgi:hypothetical protein
VPINESSMRTLARFTIRPADESPDKGNLIIGALFKQQSPLLAPGRIYEVRLVLGEMVIADVGPAAIEQSGQGLVGACWNQDVNQILSVTQGAYLLTRSEAYNRS